RHRVRPAQSQLLQADEVTPLLPLAAWHSERRRKRQHLFFLPFLVSAQSRNGTAIAFVRAQSSQGSETFPGCAVRRGRRSRKVRTPLPSGRKRDPFLTDGTPCVRTVRLERFPGSRRFPSPYSGRRIV